MEYLVLYLIRMWGHVVSSVLLRVLLLLLLCRTIYPEVITYRVVIRSEQGTVEDQGSYYNIVYFVVALFFVLLRLALRTNTRKAAVVLLATANEGISPLVHAELALIELYNSRALQRSRVNIVL